MTEDELVELLGELSIEEKEFNKAKKVLQGASQDHQDLKKSYEILSKCSQIPKLSDNIYRIMEEDMLKFLLGLQIMQDSRGIILINIIKSKVANEDLEKVILKILSLIQTILKRIDRLGLRVFYLSLYFAIISNFNISYPQHVSLMLQYLNPLHNQGNEEKEKAHEVYSLVLLVIIKNLELLVEETTEIITSYLEILVDNEPDEISITSFLNLVKCLESLFPIVPSVSNTIYMSEGCKEIILFQVSKMSSASLEYASNQLITTEILKLVSSSCINEQCRSFNYSNYLELLKIGTKLQGEDVLEIRLLSSLGIIKLWNFIQLEKDLKRDSSINMSELSDILINYLRSADSKLNDTNLEYCVEGLAYLSLNTSVKQKLRNDENSIESILVILKKKTEVNEKSLLTNSSLVYGLLLILSNLTKLKVVAANSQKKTTNYLNFATPNNINDDKDENQESIQNFNSSLLINYKVVEIMSKIKVYKSPDSAGHNNNIISQVITMISMISTNQDKSTRQELIKQGALNIVLDYLIKNSIVKKNLGNETRPSSSNDELVETRLLALRSLARILISVNPSLAFNKYDIKTCLPFLIELLGPDISQYNGSLGDAGDDQYLYDGVSNLDKYESLLALTNISAAQNSTGTNELRPLIISKTFDKYLDNFIIDSDLPQIQKATWELISNLITEPSLLVKFFNIEKQDNLKRLQLLIRLLDSTDELLQTVIGGLIANATSEFEMISQILVQNVTLKDHLLSILTNIFESQNLNDDLLLRASYILLNLVYSASKLGAEYIDKFREDKKLKDSLGLALRANKNKEILEIIIEIIKLVNFK
ncbi:uncharacterized protein AC631_03589 [Debaryomyces fabryi]|uniref:UNC-45/Cro1/She4 central domain-containing protein n=1 Tax=Debaryomyces fabryi TaxID=58627 RepID=A0A0V1PWJ6_9ASCO|nr:uncharacterized protein AC631_03589 [Debaryomyces fabryi]KSA00653.1 hypothetical protein AC631_03589 [Debaryomyces fabryi]CUM45940.1 unnamed protein product [Debaryomyces fabryi]